MLVMYSQDLVSVSTLRLLFGKAKMLARVLYIYGLRNTLPICLICVGGKIKMIPALKAFFSLSLFAFLGTHARTLPGIFVFITWQNGWYTPYSPIESACLLNRKSLRSATNRHSFFCNSSCFIYVTVWNL